MPSFVASKHIEQMTFIGTLSRVLQSLYTKDNPADDDDEQML